MCGAVRTSYKRIMEQENRLRRSKTVLLFYADLSKTGKIFHFYKKHLHWLLGAGIECNWKWSSFPYEDRESSLFSLSQ